MTAGFEDMAGRSAIVTGGATLMGAAVVRALQRVGVRVLVADIDVAGGEALARELGDGVRFRATDITDDAQIAACVAEACERHGGLHCLVNLACCYVDDGAASSRASWLKALDVNLVSAALLAAAARPALRAAGGGAIVNFGSVSSSVAQAGRWLYPASKAAMVQLTRSMAMDFAADGIRVNSVSPGWTWSAVMKQLSGDDRARTDRVAAPFHLPGRVAEPEEVANVVLFLCSGLASFVTGADYACDGGYSAMGPESSAPAIAQLIA